MITPSEIQQHQSNRFDAQFAAACKAGQIAWYPWVGAQYLSAACKVLVILESHYINWERNNIDALSLPNFTRRIVVEQMAADRWPSSSFNNLSTCLSGKAVIKGQVNLLWEKVALYNFVQRPMDNPNERPNGQDFINGWKAFQAVVDILRPDVCVCRFCRYFQYFGTSVRVANCRSNSLGKRRNQWHVSAALFHYSNTESYYERRGGKTSGQFLYGG